MLNSICIVDRKTWYRGQGGANSRLLNDEGKYCCLGYLALENGFTKEQIQDAGSPVEIGWKEMMCEGDYLQFKDTDLTNKFIDVNDSREILDSERESEIIKLGKELDVEFQFIN